MATGHVGPGGNWVTPPDQPAQGGFAITNPTLLAGDGLAVYDASANAAGAGLVNVPSAPFKPGDVGKLIAITPRTRNNTYWRYGTILQVNSPTQVLTNMNITLTYTNATLIFGSDRSSELSALIAYRQANGGGGIGISGIVCVRGSFVIPNECWLDGGGSVTPPNGIGNICYGGATLVRMDPVNTNPFITLGVTEGTSNRSAGAYGLTIEGLDTYGSVTCAGYGANVERCLLLGQVNTGPSSSFLSNYIIHNLAPGSAGFVVMRIGGDVKCKHNQIYGTGVGRAIVRIDGNGSEFSGNHIYAGDSVYGARLAGIHVTVGGGAAARGGNNIINGNVIDTPMAPAILLEATGTQILSNVNCVGNQSYQNDSVPANTHPFLQATSVVGSTIRGCNLTGNNGRSSWNNPAQGTITTLFDGSGLAGTTQGLALTGNVATDVVGSVYGGGTTPPTGVVSSSNTVVTTGGAVVTA